MNPNTTALNTYSPLFSHYPNQSDTCLDWQDLEEFFEDFPIELCKRFELVASLYDDGACSEAVNQELLNHLETCSECQTELIAQREISEKFLSVRDALAESKIEVTELEIQESFQSFLNSHGDELGQSGQELELVDTNTSDVISAAKKPRMIVEYNPPTKLAIKHKAILGLIGAAALLFAYGPALIETEIQESQFPKVNKQVQTELIQKSQFRQAAPNDLPFSAELNTKIRSTLTQESATLQKLHHVVSIDGQSSAQYDWRFKKQTIPVHLTVTSLTAPQVTHLTQKLKSKGIVLKVLKGGQQQEILINSHQSAEIQQLEYIKDRHHYQWSSQHPYAKQLLHLLAEQVAD
jgi:hypothetical protein